MTRLPTAPIASATFVVSWGVVEATGSRAAGGVVLTAGAAWCIREWYRRRGPATAAGLGLVGAAAFVASHVLGHAIGAWPAVIVVAGVGGAIVWSVADSPQRTVRAFH
jgi:hypothetical protein